jgi:hypothetical protein
MSQYVLQRIQAIQDELENLKKLVQSQSQEKPKTTQIQGLWQNITIDEQDFTEAEKAVFSSLDEWE